MRAFESRSCVVPKRLAALIAVSFLTLAVAASPAASTPQAIAVVDRELGQGVVMAVNDARVARGHVRLRVSAQLRTAARSHALSMANLGYFSHSSANGSSVTRRISSFYEIQGSKSWAVGEVLIWRRDAISAQAAVAAWLASAGHAHQLLGSWRDIGVAAVRVAGAPGVYGGHDVTIIVVDFGRRR